MLPRSVEFDGLFAEKAADSDGTALGSHAVMAKHMGTMTEPAGLTPSESSIRHTPRRRDRRLAFSTLLTTVTRALGRRGDAAFMRGAFEDTLRRVVPIRHVQLRDAGSRWGTRLDPSSGPESVSLDVPSADATLPGTLEAAFEPGCRVSEWDFQILSLAAHLGALILEIERSHAQLARAGLLNPGRPRRDGAAPPLIGSTKIDAEPARHH